MIIAVFYALPVVQLVITYQEVWYIFISNINYVDFNSIITYQLYVLFFTCNKGITP